MPTRLWSQLRFISAQQGKPINGFLVRKAEKAHGTAQRVEGFREKSARVVIVDDVCTTGASTIQAIEAAREFGFEIVGVLCLVEREEAGGGRANVEGRRPNLRRRIHRQRCTCGTCEKRSACFGVSANCDFCDRPAVPNRSSHCFELHRP